MEALQRDSKLVEESHGDQALNLVLAPGYVSKLLENTRVTRYLAQYHPEICREWQSLTANSSPEN